jgi:hypothetical protein
LRLRGCRENTFDDVGAEPLAESASPAGVPLARKNLVGSESAIYDAEEEIKDGYRMKKFVTGVLPNLCLCLLPTVVLAQGFFEYGRAVGSVPHGQGITGSKATGGSVHGGGTVGGIGDVGGRALPARLVVSAKTTGLYPRQDEETEKIEQLLEGDMLSPMVQIAGNNSWYMVKTSKGLVGWVKGADVREETAKK